MWIDYHRGEVRKKKRPFDFHEWWYDGGQTRIVQLFGGNHIKQSFSNVRSDVIRSILFIATLLMMFSLSPPVKLTPVTGYSGTLTIELGPITYQRANEAFVFPIYVAYLCCVIISFTHKAMMRDTSFISGQQLSTLFEYRLFSPVYILVRCGCCRLSHIELSWWFASSPTKKKKEFRKRWQRSSLYVKSFREMK